MMDNTFHESLAKVRQFNDAVEAELKGFDFQGLLSTDEKSAVLRLIVRYGKAVEQSVQTVTDQDTLEVALRNFIEDFERVISYRLVDVRISAYSLYCQQVVKNWLDTLSSSELKKGVEDIFRLLYIKLVELPSLKRKLRDYVLQSSKNVEESSLSLEKINAFLEKELCDIEKRLNLRKTSERVAEKLLEGK